MLSVRTARRTPPVHPRGPGAGPPTNSGGVRGGLAFSFYSSSSAHGRLTLDGGSVEVGRVALPGGGLHGAMGRYWGHGEWCQQGGLGHAGVFATSPS